MKFEVDIDKLIKNDINIYHYLFLQFVYNQDYNKLGEYLKHNERFFNKDSIDYLLSINMINFLKTEEYKLSNLRVTKKFIDQFIQESVVIGEAVKVSPVNIDKVEDWIGEWYELWPKGVKSGGYNVRSGEKGCIVKMKKFVKDYPEFTPEMIIKATKNYINSARINNYNYMQLAHYYIFKNNISTLAGDCENLTEGETDKIDYSYDI